MQEYAQLSPEFCTAVRKGFNASQWMEDAKKGNLIMLRARVIQHGDCIVNTVLDNKTALDHVWEEKLNRENKGQITAAHEACSQFLKDHGGKTKGQIDRDGQDAKRDPFWHDLKEVLDVLSATRRNGPGSTG
jgi:hypothetical protein